MNGETPDSVRYERRDVDVIALLLLLALFGITGIVVEIAAAGAISVLNRRAQSGVTSAPLPPATAQYPLPRLQPQPQQDLLALRNREDQQLSQYAWIDKSKGIVRIPIDRAMDLLVQRGLPASNVQLTSAELQQKRPEQNPPRPPGREQP